RGDAKMTDPRKDHLERAALEHLEEFLPVMHAKGKSAKDKARKEAILRAFVKTLGPLSHLTPAAVDAYLSGLRGSAGNKKKHLTAISVFVAWLLKKDRIAGKPWHPKPARMRQLRRAGSERMFGTQRTSAGPLPGHSFTACSPKLPHACRLG